MDLISARRLSQVAVGVFSSSLLSSTTGVALTVLCSAMPAWAQESASQPAAPTAGEHLVQTQMHGLYAPFRNLQRFLDASDQFEAQKNDAAIKDILSLLKAHFSKLKSLPASYHEQFGFDRNVALAMNLVDDATKRFDEGKKSYAWWRLKNLPTQCFSCHATYKADVTFSPDGAQNPDLSPLQNARFLLATRQFPAAKQVLLSVIKSETDVLTRSDALRDLLVVFVRTNQASDGVATFEDILKTVDLGPDDRSDVLGWVTSIRRSQLTEGKDTSTLTHAEHLIRQGRSAGDDSELHVDPVAILQGTALIHRLVETNTLPKGTHAKALYLLGLGYSSLPMYFVSDWAQLYLEECIEDFSGTKEAQAAYKVYREIVVDDFSGSARTNLPEDVRKHLELLKTKAYSSPDYSSPEA